MMTARRFTGRYALRTKLALVGIVTVTLAAPASAAPSASFSESVAEALAIAEGAWADTLLGGSLDMGPYDEQIFTEISPILDAEEGVKLPEDQLLTD